VYQSSRKGAAYALGKLAHPSGVPALVKALKADAPWELHNGRLRQRPDCPEMRSYVFGSSVREGLEEAGTEFAQSILKSSGT